MGNLGQTRRVYLIKVTSVPKWLWRSNVLSTSLTGMFSYFSHVVLPAPELGLEDQRGQWVLDYQFKSSYSVCINALAPSIDGVCSPTHHSIGLQQSGSGINQGKCMQYFLKIFTMKNENCKTEKYSLRGVGCKGLLKLVLYIVC